MNSELMSKLRRSKNDQRVRVMAILAQLSESLDRDSENTSYLDTTDMTTLHESCNTSFTTWKRSFSPSKSMVPSITDNDRSRRYHLSQPQKRLMSTFEKVNTAYKKRQVVKTSPKCGFCSETGHKVTNCPKRTSMSSFAMQYIICNDHSCKENCNNLILSLGEGIKHPTSYNLGADNLDSRSSSKHIIVKKVYYIETQDESYSKQFDRMIFDIVYIDKNGNPEEIDNPIKVKGEGLRTALKFSATQNKKRYVFDMTKSVKNFIDREDSHGKDYNPMSKMKFESKTISNQEGDDCLDL